MNLPNSLKFHMRNFCITALLFSALANISCGSSNGILIESQTDTTIPTVTVTTPSDGDTDVPFNRIVTASFSEAMDSATVNTLTFTVIAADSTPVAGTVSLNITNQIASFIPTAALAINTSYTATLTTGVQDVAHNSLAENVSWQFTTGTLADSIAPTVNLIIPADTATNVALNASVNATFSEHMAPLTLTTDCFSLTDLNLVTINGTASYDVDNDIATFTPTDNLAANTTYTATITTACEDLSGNALATDLVWEFTTGNTLNEDTIQLGSNNAFAILAGSTVTNTGATTINGDLGLSPGTAVTGFPPGSVNGTIHAGDTIAAQAMSDLTTAYNDAAARSTAPITVAGNLGGQTLTPGLYKSTSSLEISSGDLTLDAQGDANAVFIFQMASTLTTTVGRQVILSGGANAANIYWQAGTSVTIGTDSVFQGNILADQSITLTTGATLTGRALTRIGAVALDSNTVTTP